MQTKEDPRNAVDSALPYDLHYIPEDLRKRAKSELFEDEDTKTHSLKLLRSMLKDEKDLLWPDNELFLLAFLRARKYDVKKAFNLQKTFYTVAKKHHELYYNFNYEDVRRTLAENSIGALPYRDSEGCVILVMRAETWNPNISSMADIMRAMTCALLHAILSPATQIAGIKGIVDFSGCNLMKLYHISPKYLWLFAEALQNCFPCRFRAVHLVNEKQVIHPIWTIFKQFISQKLRDRFYFHGKNVKKLHKYFSPSILPAEFQGELPPFDNSEWASKMAESSAHFSYIFSHGYKKSNSKQRENHSKPSTSVI